MGRNQTLRFQTLTASLGAYWQMLEPVFQWQPEARRRNGYAFVRDIVFPRRAALLAIADEIAAKARMPDAVAGFRSRLIFTIGLTIGLGLLLAGFTMNRILRLEAARTELKRLSARLVEAQEQERRTIARELHEEVGQSLSGVLVELANLSTAMRARDAALMETRVHEIRALVEGSVGALRNMALLLRPSMLDDLGLVPALEWQAREVSRRSGMRVKVIAGEISENLPEEHNTCIISHRPGGFAQLRSTRGRPDREGHGAAGRELYSSSHPGRRKGIRHAPEAGNRSFRHAGASELPGRDLSGGISARMRRRGIRRAARLRGNWPCPYFTSSRGLPARNGPPGRSTRRLP